VLTHINHCWGCTCDRKVVGKVGFLEQDYDIILALNMLHHVKNMKGQKEYEYAISEIFTHAQELVILEINDKEIDFINSVAKAKGFEIAGSEYLHKLTAYGWRYVLVYRRVK